MRTRFMLACAAAAVLLVAPAAEAKTAKHWGGKHRQPTIAELAQGTPELSTLVAAAQKAGLVDALNDRNAELTVFAPTNDAFAALLAQLGLTSLDQVPVDTLRAILLDHVLGEADSSWDL